MARCLANEKYGRPIFYGAMITEGIVALIWATLGMAFYQDGEALDQVVLQSGPGGVVSDVANGYLGSVGGIFAVLSVVLLSITSGDTAFRSARLTVGDYWQKDNQSLKKRLFISIIVLSGGICLSFFDLTTIWLYFGWANQLLASVTLWMATFYLYKERRFFFIIFLPAGFMTAICTSYILQDKIGFHLPVNISDIIGAALGVLLVIIFILTHKSKQK